MTQDVGGILDRKFILIELEPLFIVAHSVVAVHRVENLFSTREDIEKGRLVIVERVGVCSANATAAEVERVNAEESVIGATPAPIEMITAIEVRAV